MGYLYLDESGDLGFDFTKKNTSKYFVIACTYFRDKKAATRIVKRTFKKMPRKIVLTHCGVLHCVKDSEQIRKTVFNLISRSDIVIFSIVLHKRNVYDKLRMNKATLYNYVTSILLDRIYRRNILPKEFLIHLIASRRETNHLLNENFKKYLEGRINGNKEPQVRIQIASPANEKGLQVVDYASWAIFRNREGEDGRYRKVIQQKIVEEGELFPHEKTKPYALLE